MEYCVGRVAVVTGASAGIGKAIAKELVNNGVTVVGLARTESQLQETAEELKESKGKFHYKAVDLKKEDEIFGAFNWIDETLGGIYLLVNNAGLFHYTSLLDGNTEEWRDIMDVQVLGVNVCTRETVKNMKKWEIDGIIININSTVAQGMSPTFPLIPVMYTVSKRALAAITQGLRQELLQQKSRIRVSSINPGLVRTEKVLSVPEYATMPGIDPKDAANAVVYIMTAPPHVEISELTIRAVGEEI